MGSHQVKDSAHAPLFAFFEYNQVLPFVVFQHNARLKCVIERFPGFFDTFLHPANVVLGGRGCIDRVRFGKHVQQAGFYLLAVGNGGCGSADQQGIRLNWERPPEVRPPSQDKLPLAAADKDVLSKQAKKDRLRPDEATQLEMVECSLKLLVGDQTKMLGVDAFHGCSSTPDYTVLCW